MHIRVMCTCTRLYGYVMVGYWLITCVQKVVFPWIHVHDLHAFVPKHVYVASSNKVHRVVPIIARFHV